MSEAAVERREGDVLGKAALAAGILAALGFFGLGFALGDWWFVVGLVFGAIAVVLGVMARRRFASGPDRRMATIGLVLGAIIVAWFVAYMILAAIF